MFLFLFVFFLSFILFPKHYMEQTNRIYVLHFYLLVFLSLHSLLYSNSFFTGIQQENNKCGTFCEKKNHLSYCIFSIHCNNRAILNSRQKSTVTVPILQTIMAGINYETFLFSEIVVL